MTETVNNTFQFELVSPAKKLAETPAYQVIVPGQDGDLGVRKGHASFVVSVRPGVVEILKSEGDTPERIFVAGGFADVSAENCTVLAEEAIPVQDLNIDEINAEIATVEEELSADDANSMVLSKALDILKAKQVACQ
jgi:F-type H+-transporting ATPase subunit epsilon